LRRISTMDDDDQDQQFMVVPSDLKKLRACLRCYLIKTEHQFTENGCENCPFLRLEEDRDSVQQCTTTSFEGVVSMINTKDSWVARWEKLGALYPGCYAIQANGVLPARIRRACDERGYAYRKPRKEQAFD